MITPSGHSGLSASLAVAGCGSGGARGADQPGGRERRGVGRRASRSARSSRRSSRTRCRRRRGSRRRSGTATKPTSRPGRRRRRSWRAPRSTAPRAAGRSASRAVIERHPAGLVVDGRHAPSVPHTSAFVISFAPGRRSGGEGECGDGRQDQHASHGGLPSHWTERAIASARDLVTSASRRSVSSPRRQTRVGPASRVGDFADAAGGVLVDQPVRGAAEPVARLAVDPHALDRRARPGELADQLRVGAAGELREQRRGAVEERDELAVAVDRVGPAELVRHELALASGVALAEVERRRAAPASAPPARARSSRPRCRASAAPCCAPTGPPRRRRGATTTPRRDGQRAAGAAGGGAGSASSRARTRGATSGVSGHSTRQLGEARSRLTAPPPAAPARATAAT